MWRLNYVHFGLFSPCWKAAALSSNIVLLDPSGVEEMVHTDPVCPQVGFLCHDQFEFSVYRTIYLSPPSVFYSYLHSCDPPIIHGNLTCDTVFIQHNGLIKIGSGIKLHQFHLGGFDRLGYVGGVKLY